MKTAKRTLAVFLAALMALGSLTAVATLNDGNQKTIQSEVRFYRQVGSEWVETTEVVPGEVVRASIFLESDFIVGRHALVYLYNKNLLTLNVGTGEYQHTLDDENGGDLMGPYTAQSTGIYRKGEFLVDESGTTENSQEPVTLGLLDASVFDTYGVLFVDGNQGRTGYFDGREYYYFYFKVNEAADINDINQTVGSMFLAPEYVVKDRATLAFDEWAIRALAARLDNVPYRDAQFTDPDVYAPEDYVLEVTNIKSKTLADAQGATPEEIQNNTSFTYSSNSDPAQSSYLKVADKADTEWLFDKDADGVIEAENGEIITINDYIGTNLKDIAPDDSAFEIPFGYNATGWPKNNDNVIVDDAGNLQIVAGGNTITSGNPVTYGLEAKTVTVNFYPPFFISGNRWPYLDEDGATSANASVRWTGPAGTTNAVLMRAQTINVNYADAYSVPEGFSIVPANTSLYEFKGWIPFTTGTGVSLSTDMLDHLVDFSSLTAENATYNGSTIHDDGNGNLVLDLAPVILHKNVTVTWHDVVRPDNNQNITGESSTMYAGTAVSSRAMPPITGYTFKWYTDPEFTTEAVFDYTVMEDTDFYGRYEINSYTVTYKVDGEQYGEQDTYDYNETVTVRDEPTKEGYTFSGWNTSALNEGKMPANDVEITGTFGINQYTITFDSNEGSAVDPITQDYNTAVNAPADPTRTGYTFGGWFNDDDTFADEFVFDENTKMPAQDITVHAKWIANVYTINYSTDGSAVAADTLTYDTDDVPAKSGKVTSKTGYTFDDWYLEAAYTTSYTPDWDTVLANAAPKAGGNANEYEMTVYAKFDANIYTINYNTDGSAVAADTLTYDTDDVPAKSGKVTTKTGYTFDDWYLEAAYTTAYTSDWDTVLANSTPKAGGEANEYEMTVYAKFDANVYTINYNTDGSAVAADTLTYGTDDVPAKADRVTAKTGYTFDDWYLEAAFTTSYTADWTTVLANAAPKAGGNANEYEMTVYAKFDANVYTINYNTDGSAVAADTLTYGTDDVPAKAERVTSKTGYTFDDWYLEAAFTTSYTPDWDTVLANSAPKAGGNANEYEMTVYANWTANVYTIRYDSNEGTAVENDVLVYDTDDVPAKTDRVTTRTGYVFDDWYLDDETFANAYTSDWATVLANAQPVAGGADNEYELSVYANWEKDTFYIDYDANGGVLADGTVEHKGYLLDDTIAAVGNPTRTGYTFASWKYTKTETGEQVNVIPGTTTMPAYNITATAQWTANVYVINYNVDGGSAVVSDVLTYDTDDVPAKADKVTAKTGYTFDDWYLDAAFTNAYTSDWATVLANAAPKAGGNPNEFEMTVYAKFDANIYTINYNTDGSAVAADTLTYGTDDVPAKADKVTAKTGYTFDDWYLEAAYTTSYTSDWTTVLANAAPKAGGNANEFEMTVYAKFDANIYTVRYDSNEGAAVENSVLTYGTDSVPADVVTTRTGYTFDNWYLDDETFANAYVPTWETVLANAAPKAGGNANEFELEVYAKWIINVYNVIYDAKGGTINGSPTFTFHGDYNTNIAVPSTPVRTGYTFNGWYLDDETFASAYTPDWNVITSNSVLNDANGQYYMTVYADWIANQYTIIYETNDGEQVAQDVLTYTDGTDEVPQRTTEKTGFAFDGWYFDNETFASAYAGTWSSITDNATLVSDNRYTLTVYAKWNRLSFNVIYYSNGEEWETITDIAYEADYTEEVPEDPDNKTGYTFDSWKYYTGYSDNTFTTEYRGSTMPAQNLYADAQFTANTYRINYVTNGGNEIGADEIVYTDGTDSIPERIAAGKTGYEFDDWYLDSELTQAYTESWETVLANTAINEDGVYEMTVYAGWNALPFDVIFDSASGAWQDSSTQKTVSVYFDSAIVWPVNEATPEKTGYEFAGWFTDAEGGTELSGDILTTTEQVTYYAHYNPLQYDATFIADANTAYEETIRVYYDAEIVYEDVPLKTGYNFLGWSRTEGSTVPDASLGTMDDVNGVTFYGVFEAKSDYTLTFDGNNGKWGNETTYVVEGETYDETIIVPDEMPAQTGYHVIGYSMTRIAPEEVEELSDSIYFIDAATGNTTPELPDFTTATNRTWYYVWAIDTHTVTYNANTGAFEDDETIKTKELDYGSIIPAYDTDPVKYGYNFAGWNTEADGSGTYVTLYNQGSAVPTPVTGDIEVFAIYRKGAVTVNYYVTIDGTTKLYDSYNMNYGDTVEPIEYISDEYTVTWYTDQAMTAELPAAGFEITSTDTINIYGVISGKSYTATFTLGLGDGEGAEWPEGTTVNADNAVEKTFVYEEDIIAPVPTWEGHRFLGYSPDVGTMPAADVTFEALWTENEYVIHYMTDGAEYEVIPVYLNGELDTPEDPEKTGYTFAEWKYYTDSALQTAFTGTAMPARDLYADAVWDINTYEITYVAGEGAELGADTETPKAFDYNATITVPENNPVKPGYAFTGWRYTDADNNVYTGTTMPAYNLTATAKWGVLFTTYNYYITTDGGDRLVETASVPYGSTYIISSYSDDTVSVTQWTATVNGETVIYNTGDEITVGTTGNIVLTGVNDTAEYTATFTLGTGASAGAEWAEGTVTTDAGTVEQTYVAGAKINAPVPTWTGHQFVGYAPEAESMPTADTTYEAVWVTDELTVTYMVDGAEYEKSVVSVGDALSAELPEDPEKEGHEFVGWDYYDADDNEYSGALMPNYNLIAIAQFDVLKYTLTWAYTVPGETEETKVVYDGADGHKDQVYYGTVLEEVEKPVVDEVEGYVFTWDAFDETMPAEDYTIHGTFTIQQYTLTWTYTVPGADEATVKSDDIDYATAITGYKPDVTPVEGYEFNWYEDAEGTTEYDFETNGTMPAQALTVYGVFKIKSHNLIWSYVDPATNETVETAPESVEYGTELAPLAPEVTITGYDFTWNYNGVTTMPDDDLTIYGTTNKQSFTVTYVKGDGVWSDDDTENKVFTVIFEADEVPVPVEELSREYYTFGGWINEADENKAPTDYATMPAKNLTFTAVWNRIEVKLVPNGSSSTAMIERDGVVETYNEFGAGDATPYGVTSIIEPTATRTETEDFSRWFVYGLSEGLTEEQLRAAVTVQGDGEFTVAPITTGSIGTGAVITVTDRVTGKVVEQFYVVIFGDVDGDSVARSADTGEVRDEIADSTWAGEGLYCKVKAADLDGSGNITGNDVSRLKSAVRNVKEIDQITGLAK